MNNPLVSVIIPIYNVEDYLPRCLDSLMGQTYTNLEIIAVNDGSPDGCLAILRSYAQKDKRIKIVDQENQGVSTARNNGLKEATGEIVAFVDPDDWVHPQYFEILVGCMVRENAHAVFCEFQRVTGSDLPDESPRCDLQGKAVTLEDVFSSHTMRHYSWARIYKREILEGYSFPRELSRAEDTMFNLNVLRHVRNPRFYYYPDVLYFWYMREGSLTHSKEGIVLLDAADWYLEHRDSQESSDTEWLLLSQFIRWCLSQRFHAKIEDTPMNSRRANATLKKLIPIFDRLENVPVKEKIGLTAFSVCPFVYRAVRWIRDPSMLTWERLERQKRRESRGENGESA